jgi:diamine N-acetyltransferase
METPMKMIHAGTNDIPVLQKLAEEVWWKHYPEIIGESQVKYMLDLFYSEQALTEQMITKGHQFFFINDGESKVGFISVEEKTDCLFINKFYILPTLQGKSIGTITYSAIKEMYKHLKLARLTVNRQNFKSINFYFKLGFKIEQVIDIPIDGGFVMNDFIMMHQW